LLGDALGVRPGPHDGVDRQAGWRAEEMQQQVAGVSESGDEPEAKQIEEREDDLGGAVGVGRVLEDWQLGVQDRLARVDQLRVRRRTRPSCRTGL